MANVDNRWPQNTTGRYYVDRECIDCNLCRGTAPENFKRIDNEGHSFVDKQPETPEELALCEEARELCPVNAIGCDGGPSAAPAPPASPSPGESSPAT